MATGGKQRIQQQSIDSVLHRSDLGDLVSGFTQLRKQGAELLGRCPFHEERTPSFWVNPTKGVYHCFGCGASGDTITFVQEKLGLDFLESIEYLADRYRVQLEYEGGDGKGPARPRVSKRKLYELMDSAASFYEAFLWQASAASAVREYLAGRGISEETAKAFRIGCSPEGGQVLCRKAQQKGFTREELTEARLITSRGSDFFRGRLMVPIIDRADRVVAFGARKLRQEQFGGKYVNSADGPLFHKRETVYVAPGIRDAAKAAGAVVVVEGYMDVIAMWQAGFKHVCAVMGANLTEEQIVELKRMAPRAIFAFDPDTAGEKATLGALELARRHELDVRVVRLPEGQDPADILAGAEGHDRMEEMLASGVSLLHYRVGVLLGSGNLSDDGDRERIWRDGVKFFRSVPDSPERRRQIDRFGFGLGLDADGVASLQRAAGGDAQLPELRRARPAQHQDLAATRQRSPHDSAVLTAERRLLAVAMSLVDAGRQVGASAVTPEMFVLDVHRRAWAALQAGTRLEAAEIREDRELIGLVGELGALVQRDRADQADFATLLAEYQQRLELGWIDRTVAGLREQMRESGEQDEPIIRMGELLKRRRELDPRSRTAPVE